MGVALFAAGHFWVWRLLLVDLALAEAAALGAVGGARRCRFWEDGIERRRRRRILGGGFI